MRRTLISIREKKLRSNKIERVYALYDYLKENAVGEVYKKSANQIILALNGLFTSRQEVEEAIQIIRMSLDLMVGSNINGYWIMCSDDKTDGYAYMKNQALSKMKVAIMCGVNPNIFFKELNQVKDQCNDVADGQVVMVDTPYQRPIIRRYGDELRKQNQ